MHRILVWDLPTRVFHWLYAVCFATAWLTSEWDAAFAVHMLCGVLLLGLLLFRLIWGLVGGRYARFASFAHGPGAGWAYLKALAAGTANRHIGHNPAGSQAVWLLLGLGPMVALAGLATWLWPEGTAGELWGEILGEGHELLANLMLAVVALHLLGVAAESWLHKENLAAAMLHGRKVAPAGTLASRGHAATGVLLLVLAVVFAAAWLRYADFAVKPEHEREHEEADHHPQEHEDPKERYGLWRHKPTSASLLPASSTGQPSGQGSGMGGTGVIIHT